jgi:hypothetical protein
MERHLEKLTEATGDLALVIAKTKAENLEKKA